MRYFAMTVGIGERSMPWTGNDDAIKRRGLSLRVAAARRMVKARAVRCEGRFHAQCAGR